MLRLSSYPARIPMTMMEYPMKKEYVPPHANRQNGNMTFYRWLFRSGHLPRLIISLLVILIVIPLITHYYLSKAEVAAPGKSSQLSLSAIQSMKPLEIKTHLEELYRIKESVLTELREIEEKRKSMQSQLNQYTKQIERVQMEISTSNGDLERVKSQIAQKVKEQEEVVERSQRHISAPKQILPNLEDNFDIAPPQSSARCRQHNCFDYSRCSLTSHFPVYVYNTQEASLTSAKIDSFVRTSVLSVLSTNPYVTFDPNIACVYLVIIGDTEDHGRTTNSIELESQLHKLPLWKGDGRNHVLLNLARNVSARNTLEHINTGRAMIVQTGFSESQFRPGFDIISPMLLGKESGFIVKQVPLQIPARRQYFISFQGVIGHSSGKTIDYVDENNPPLSRRLKADLRRTSRTDSSNDFILEELEKLKHLEDDKVYIELSCKKAHVDAQAVDASEWNLCLNAQSRRTILKESTYTLIVAPDDHIVSSTTVYTRLYEALQTGAIPVILGEHIQLPFGEFIDWAKVVVTLPKARVTEMYFYLKTIQDTDLLAMRRQGWFIWTTYLSSSKSVLDGILATLRTRLSIPASIVRDEPSPSIFHNESPPKTLKVEHMLPESDDVLPPAELPFPSPKYLRNFTSLSVSGGSIWNNPPGPFHLYPFTPFDPILPSDAKFTGSGLGFRPIGGGAGGAGKEFQESIGGNVPGEQFTIVMLTYERETVLLTSLQRLMGLPYLNKILVVWNSPEPPNTDIVWPEIHVPIKVIKTKKNSLNNRFLPYDEIETEAILSIDDDAHLRHDEILFGFRVWREARDRIVGFPGRFHAWDLNNKNGFLYNANYSCELSMVLTGAAFFHKYYAYLYSYTMPQAIRDKVDEFMNCEDIAMNFLASHITRKPPIKVTSRWTFRCPGCPDALSMDDSHFQERHLCIQYFTSIYGYTPLVYTQFRVDSVLFKTRLPHDKQKCFKFI
ncbi:LOW QUALITY PROTEIN: exostosin-like 3 [Amphiura filiformis]|uniref:LOW QUALITY PROTEIN: exostosin-like 3 n=1 Tax=Amphiura filiformis TaxID=82378 RepID=UPI003B216DCA